MKLKNDPPFRKNFILGILIIPLSQVLARILGTPWAFYLGASIGLIIAIMDCIKYLTQDMHHDIDKHTNTDKENPEA